MVFLGAFRAVALQNVKLRVPSIRFRKGNVATGSHTPSGTGVEIKRTSNQQIQSVVQELPERFRRQPLSEEEIEYINRGGPA